MSALSHPSATPATPRPPATPADLAPPSDPRPADRAGCPLHRASVMLADLPASWIARTGILLYGLLAYAAFFGTIVYAIGFVTGLLVPKTLDTVVAGTSAPSVPVAIAINGALLSVFVVQHTVMARLWFKRWITRFIPDAMERSTFVLLASLSLMLVFWQWRPMPEVLLQVEQPVVRWLLTGVSLIGWSIVFGSSFLIDHFDLFGVRQAVAGFRRRRPAPIRFQTIGLYRYVRHPLMLGFVIAVWATPTMTVGHLFFAAMITAYIHFGVWIEERDLVMQFGDRYRQYRDAVPGIYPIRLPRKRA